ARDETGVRMLDRRDDVCDVRLRERQHDTRDGGGERGVADRRGPRLDEDALARREVEAGAIEDLLGAPRLAVRVRPALQLLRAHGAAHDHREDGDREPPEGRGLPMRGAPAPRAAGEVDVAHDGSVARGYPDGIRG